MKVSGRIKEGIIPYLFILPAVVLVVAFMAWPLAFSFWLSLTNYHLVYSEKAAFIGLSNFIRLLSDPTVLNAAKVTGIYAAIGIVGRMFIGLFLAILIESKIRGKWLFRSAVFMPLVIASTIIALIWNFMLAADIGIINVTLRRLGLGFLERSWTGDPSLALYTISAVSIWAGVGVPTIYFIAGLKGIPEELYDSAKVDGAGWLQQQIHITIPSLKEWFIIVGIMQAISSIKSFDLPFVMTGGGPMDKTTTFYILIYRVAFDYNKLGYAAAIAYFMLIIILILAYANTKIFRPERR